MNHWKWRVRLKALVLIIEKIEAEGYKCVVSLRLLFRSNKQGRGSVPICAAMLRIWCLLSFVRCLLRNVLRLPRGQHSMRIFIVFPSRINWKLQKQKSNLWDLRWKSDSKFLLVQIVEAHVLKGHSYVSYFRDVEFTRWDANEQDCQRTCARDRQNFVFPIDYVKFWALFQSIDWRSRNCICCQICLPIDLNPLCEVKFTSIFSSSCTLL